MLLNLNITRSCYILKKIKKNNKPIYFYIPQDLLMPNSPYKMNHKPKIIQYLKLIDNQLKHNYN